MKVNVLVTQSCPSLWPHGLEPTRLLCPWKSTGKNTGMGCHSLLQGIVLTQGSDPGLLHCRHSLYNLATREAQSTFMSLDLFYFFLLWSLPEKTTILKLVSGVSRKVFTLWLHMYYQYVILIICSIILCFRLYINTNLWWKKAKVAQSCRLFVTPRTMQSMEFSRSEYWSGSLSLLWGLFPTRESHRGLLHCRLSHYQLSHPGSPVCGTYPHRIYLLTF